MAAQVTQSETWRFCFTLIGVFLFSAGLIPKRVISGSTCHLSVVARFASDAVASNTPKMRFLSDVSRHTRRRRGVVRPMLTSKYRHGHSHVLHTRLHALLTKLDKLQVRVQPLLA